jgi:hypothetical protein
VSVVSPVTITFDSAAGRIYALLPNPQVWIEFMNNIPGTGSPIEITDSSEAANRNYRVLVQLNPAP